MSTLLIRRMMAVGVAAQAAGPAVEFALDLLDEFLLDGLQKGWHPRMFFDDLRKLDRIENKEKKLGPQAVSGRDLRRLTAALEARRNSVVYWALRASDC